MNNVFLVNNGKIIDSLKVDKGRFSFSIEKNKEYSLRYESFFNEKVDYPVISPDGKDVKVNLVVDELPLELNMENILDNMSNNDSIVILTLLNDLGEFSRFYEPLVITKKDGDIIVKGYNYQYDSLVHWTFKKLNHNDIIRYLATCKLSFTSLLSANKYSSMNKFYNEILHLRYAKLNPTNSKFILYKSNTRAIIYKEGFPILYKYNKLKKQLRK